MSSGGIFISLSLGRIYYCQHGCFQGPLAIRMAKRAINEGLDVEMASALAVEERCYNSLLNTDDRLEGLAAFAEKRKPRYSGK